MDEDWVGDTTGGTEVDRLGDTPVRTGVEWLGTPSGTKVDWLDDTSSGTDVD